MDSLSILQVIGGCVHEMSLSRGLYVGLFLAGLIGGFTHCIAMCGAFVVSQTGHIEKMREGLLLPYHLGRITTYVVMAMLLSSILNFAFLFMPMRSLVVAPILMIAALVFFVTAFPALQKLFPWVTRIQMAIPYQWLSKAVQRFAQRGDVLSKYSLGVLLGFVPCGLIVAALMAAATAPTFWQAGIAMGVFGVGTVPALLVVSFGGQALQHKYPLVMQKVSQGFMVLSGLWLFVLAGLVLV